MGARIALTLDMDWAPDFAILQTAFLLISAGVKATWFVTHQTATLDLLRQHSDLFELGIHPNYASGSTQGSDPKNVLENLLSIVPEAVSHKSHALLESTHLLETLLAHTPVLADLTTMLPAICLREPALYEWKGRFLHRIPCCWEDNFQFHVKEPVFTPDRMPWLNQSGIAAYTFHPIHVVLNSRTGASYLQVKNKIGFSRFREEHLTGYVYNGEGIRTAFEALVAYASRRQSSVRVKDIIDTSTQEAKV